MGIDDNTIYGETGEEMAKAVEKVGGLLKNWSYLQTEQMKSQLNDAVYNEEMEKIKKEFKATMDRIDKKSAVMTESLKKANTAMNSDELRKALVDLAGVAETHLNESDLTAILRGEKSLEI